MVRVHLGGHLNWYDPQKRAWLELRPGALPSVRGLVEQLGLPPGELAVIALNGRLIELDDTPLADGDRIDFYPPMGGG